jgi:hypothetical protein
MTDDFKPPITSRTTQELLEIAGAPKKWNERALQLALDELYHRKVDAKQIDQAKYIEKRKVQFEKLKKAKEGYTFFDFIFEPTGNLFEILFSWNLLEDGYILKAEQQRKYRPIILINNYYTNYQFLFSFLDYKTFLPDTLCRINLFLILLLN